MTKSFDEFTDLANQYVFINYINWPRNHGLSLGSSSNYGSRQKRSRIFGKDQNLSIEMLESN